jgi:hypothetical protein
MHRPQPAHVKRRTAMWRCLLVGPLVTMLSACQDTTRDPAATPAESSRGVAVTMKYPLQENPLAGCSLCHVDVEDEFVRTRHFKEQIGCKTCHGPSEAHLADENNEIKPDELFARKDVDELCQRCHECGRSNVAETPTNKAKQPLVCIDCHGHHTLVLAPTPQASE